LEEDTMNGKRGWTSAFLVLGCLAAVVSWRSGAEGLAPEERTTGVVDAGCYRSLQEAIDALPANGGVLRIPPGTYELNQPLVLTREDTRIEGAGAATHLLNRNEEGQPALILRPKNRASNKGARIWRVQLADLRISGNPKSGTGLQAEGINEIYLHGLSIDHNGGHGIDLVDCYEDPRVCDSILTYNGKAGLNLLRCHDIVVSANQFEENQDALRCIDSFNLCMNGNNLDDHLRHGVVIENTYGSVLSGNMIEECKGTAIVLGRDCYGDTVSANVIAHNFGGGVDLEDAWGCAVSANTFTIDHEWGVRVGPESGRITVTGNNFCNSYIGGKLKRTNDEPATGILLQKTKHITISGNSFTGLAGAAVRSEGACARLLISSNVMTDLHRKNPKGGLALELEGKPSESVIVNNIVDRAGGEEPR
jgi:hypothetical protein